jgi:hypothetical protein
LSRSLNTMQRIKLFSTLVLLVVGFAIIYVFRDVLINQVQLHLLGKIRKRAVFSNAVFARPGNSHQQHRLYSLTGLDRIWPHRVNSIRRLHFLYPDFAGFECDIQFDAASNKLFIAHDSDDINSPVFTDYLSGEDKDHKLFWLDVKNLDSLNQESFCSDLQQLDQQYDIKNRVIIESPNSAVLSRINKSGWLCSLYLPSAFSKQASDSQNSMGDIAGYLQTNTGLISQDASLHDLMTKDFPQAKQLIWDIRFKDALNKDLLLKLANDSSLLLCLINVKSPGYR